MKITKTIAGEVIGELTLKKLVGNEWEIQMLKVNPLHRGKGIASELLELSKAHARKRGLVLVGLVWPDSDGSMTHDQISQWLKRHGFKFGWYDFNEARHRTWVHSNKKRVWIYNES